MDLKEKTLVFQSENGAIELRWDAKTETVWANLDQISELFGRDKSVISRHFTKIFGEGELDRNRTVAKNATVQNEGWKSVVRQIEYYNLDAIISVGYRVNSKTATRFRQWATATLKKHVVEGYTVNPSRITENYGRFLEAVESVRKLVPDSSDIRAKEVLDLVKTFAETWISLDAYDRSALPTEWQNLEQVTFAAEELSTAIRDFKAELVKKGEATDLFAQEKREGSFAGIVGNVMQSVFWEDAYPSAESKAAHLLYFIVKNHVFNDGNKRSWAYAFVWFLHRAGKLDVSRISPEALTALTLLIAESDPKEKERMTGLVILLLSRN